MMLPNLDRDVTISASLRLGGEPRSSDAHVIVVGDAAGMIDPMTGGSSSYRHIPVCMETINMFNFFLYVCVLCLLLQICVASDVTTQNHE